MLCRDSRQSFLFYSDNVPRECCSFPKFFLILYCRNCGYQCRFSADIFTKVFFAVLNRKCGSFHKRGQRTALISCVAMWLCTVCAYTHTIQVWGIVSFILLRSFHNLLFNKREINSTLSLFIYPTILELYGFERQFIINSKHKQL